MLGVLQGLTVALWVSVTSLVRLQQQEGAHSLSLWWVGEWKLAYRWTSNWEQL